MSVVAAAGNDDHAHIKSPANCPSVIAVGGIDDKNALDAELEMYHSTFGKTVDGLMKPELVANAIWLAAPILAGTAEHREAHELHARIKRQDITSFEKDSIIHRIAETKFFSPDYMHVDGTSFAAPIVSSVIAQLIQASPWLKPAEIRSILFSTAKRLENVEASRQGFGYIQPRKALIKSLRRKKISRTNNSPYIDSESRTVEFYIESEFAHQISVCGSFNEWTKDHLLLEPGMDGVWKIKMPFLPAGKHYYKFLINGHMWTEDVENPLREPDGFNGWNSILLIN